MIGLKLRRLMQVLGKPATFWLFLAGMALSLFVLYWFMGAVSALMLFASVLLHELGHSVVAMRYNIPVRSITLPAHAPGVRNLAERVCNRIS